jgi:hypothetical protein
MAMATASSQPVASATASSQDTAGVTSSVAALTASAPTQFTSGGSNLAAVTSSGALAPAVTSGSADVRQFFIAPNQKVYVVFSRPINLSDTTSWAGPRCLLAEVDRASGVPSCVDGTLSAINWPSPRSGSNSPIQFDAAGAVYYSGWTMGGTVLRKYLNGVSTDLVSDNIQLWDFLVLPHGDVLLSGTSSASGAQWLRRLTAGGSLQTLRGVRSNFLRIFPDRNVYMGFTGGTDFGVERYLTSTNQIDPKYWYYGLMNDPAREFHYRALDSCDGSLWTIREAFCGSYGASIQNSIETSDGKVFVVAGWANGGGMLMKYYPTIEAATTSVGKVLASVGAGDEVIVAGLDDAGQNKTVVYHPATDTETQLIGADNEIEMYHLTHVPNSNSVMFEGLRFSDNHVVLGQINLDTGEVTVSASLPSKLQDLQAFH